MKCQCDEWYSPCRNGVHVCAKRDCGDHESAVTELNIPCRSKETARRLFDRLKSEFADADGDMVVDLMQGGDINDDFWITRQMLDRLKQASQNSNAH